MADDYAGNATTTGNLGTGTAIPASLEVAGDVDWFRVTLAAGYAYQFNLAPAVTFSGGGLNETLIRSDGTVAAGGSGTRTITVTPTSAGTYYLSIAAASASMGNYTVSSAATDDYTADFSTTGRLAVNGGATTASLQTSADHDYLAVSLTAGVTYKFNIAAAATFSSSGLNERLIRSDGVSVNNGDNYLYGDRNYTFSYIPTATGTFYLDVYSGSNGTGTYTVTTTSPDPALASIPVYRFFDSKTGTQFLTSSDSERATVIATRPDLINEGTGLRAAASSDPNASPVYRFFDKVYGTHFFTSSANESNTIRATRSDLSYEGIGFNEYATQQANTSPVYRFFDSNKGTHFFTASESERATIISTRSDLVPEGVSFYSPNT